MERFFYAMKGVFGDLRGSVSKRLTLYRPSQQSERGMKFASV